MILYSKQRLSIALSVAEFHHDEQGPPPRVDIVRYQSRPEKVNGTVCYPFWTLLIDLKQDPDVLFSQMAKTTRQEIRRASKEDLVHEFSDRPGNAWMADFFEFFGEFARLKGLAGPNCERIRGMRASEALLLSRVSAPDGTVLVWHCYIRANDWVRLIYSASLFRAADKPQQALISRANRLLHWLDMQRFREMGFTYYDLGGWYSGKDDEEKLKINKFKESLGGRVTAQYNTDHGLTLKGMLAVRIRHVAGKFKEKSRYKN